MSNIGGYDKQWAWFRYMIWMPTTMIVGALMWIPVERALGQPPFVGCLVYGVLYGFVWLALSKAFMPRTVIGSVLLGAISPFVVLVATCVGVLLLPVVGYFWWAFVPGGVLVGIADIHVRRLIGDVRPPPVPPEPPPPMCWSCEYDLHGLPKIDGVIRCPECGTMNRPC